MRHMDYNQSYSPEEKVEMVLQYMREHKIYSAYKAVKAFGFGEYGHFKRVLKQNPGAYRRFLAGVQEVQNELCASTGMYAHTNGADDSM